MRPPLAHRKLESIRGLGMLSGPGVGSSRKDELNDVDRSSQDQADKSTFGKRTKTAHKWFDGLSKEKKREAELAADKWN